MLETIQAKRVPVVEPDQVFEYSLFFMVLAAQRKSTQIFQSDGFLPDPSKCDGVRHQERVCPGAAQKLV